MGEMGVRCEELGACTLCWSVASSGTVCPWLCLLRLTVPRDLMAKVGEARLRISKGRGQVGVIEFPTVPVPLTGILLA